MPAITVLMPAYNCEKLIGEAIQSVLDQTFTDFELLILDDGSTDNTPSVIEGFHDPRIRVQKNDHDYIASLNSGLEMINTPYLARMDADDLMAKDRLQIQYAILEEYPEIDVCSGWMQLFGENIPPQLSKTVAGYVKNPLLLMLQTNFVFNATTMCRTAFVRKHQLRYKYYMYAEDLLFWSEAARAGATFFVESQIFHYYRMWENQVGRKYWKEQDNSAWKIRQEVIQWLVDDQTDHDIRIFHEQAKLLLERNQLTPQTYLLLFHQLLAVGKLK